MAAPPPCNSLPLRRRRDHDSVEDQSEDQKRSKVGDQDFVREELNTDSVPKVEEQSDPFAKLKSSGGVASLTDWEIFDMWLAMRGGKTYLDKQEEEIAYINFQQNIREEPADQDEYTYNRLSFADKSKEEIKKAFRNTGKPDRYNGYVFKSNIAKWPMYAKLWAAPNN